MELHKFKSELSIQNKIVRVVWGIVWAVLFRPSPRLMHGWRRFLLRSFGAKIGAGVRIYNSAIVYYPPNLHLENQVVIGPKVELYCVAPIRVGQNSMISQYSYLCAATHNYKQNHLPLIAKPIAIGEGTWICARAFVGPGVRVGNHVVVAACAVVVKDVADQLVVGGNPASEIKKRETPT
ncbi:MAG: putative colanic acid biosynthesis acetyltransferase [Planctomycetota bacterium]